MSELRRRAISLEEEEGESVAEAYFKPLPESYSTIAKGASLEFARTTLLTKELLTQAAALPEVNTPETYTRAGNLLRLIKGQRKKVQAFFDGIIRVARARYQQVLSQRNEADA